MANPVKIFRKYAAERRRLYISYDCWLADSEELTDFQITVYPYTADGPITVTSGYPDTAHRKLVMFVAGGTGNTNYTLQMVARTNAGQVKRDDIGIRVLP